MSSNEPKPWKLKVFCWRCWQRREPDNKKKPEQFAARKLVNGKIKSEGLQCHLNMNEDCRRHYWDNLDLRVALHSSSLIEYCPHPKIKEQFNKHKARLNNKARNIGLSIAPYRPVVKPARVILDSEVMYNQSIEPIDGRLLHSAMYSDEEALQKPTNHHWECSKPGRADWQPKMFHVHKQVVQRKAEKNTPRINHLIIL